LTFWNKNVRFHLLANWAIKFSSFVAPAATCPLRQEKIENTQAIARSRKSKNIQCNGHKKMNNDLQNTTQKTKNWVTQTPLKTGGELICSRMVSNSGSTSGTLHVTLVTKSVTSHEWEKDWVMITTNRTYPWSFATQIFCKC
jgi:hypothetical protein